jgi:hypothetical protein
VTLDPADPIGNKAATGTYNTCDYCDLRDACESASLTSQLRASIQRAEAANA